MLVDSAEIKRSEGLTGVRDPRDAEAMIAINLLGTIRPSNAPVDHWHGSRMP